MSCQKREAGALFMMHRLTRAFGCGDHAVSERLFGDRPISHPQDDTFGLSSFADALATSLLQMSPKDGLVISVEGPWGAGKSSAIALAVRTIKLRELVRLGEGLDQLERLSESQLDDKWIDRAKTRKTHVVRFNPWNFSGQENLVRAFFGEMAAQLKIEPTGWVRRQFDRVSSYLPAVGSSVGAGGAIFSGSALPGIAAAAGAIGRALGEIGQKAFGLDNSLEGAKTKLAEALREADQRIIVIIDDLDRLLPSEMRAVFSLVKSLGDLPGVLYVLSFDEAVVREALSESAEKIDPAFLEKIVQVSLKLPPPWRDELRQMLFTRLNAIIGDAEPADHERWRSMLTRAIDPYLETPRDVTRLANTLQVIWPNVAGDVDLTDVIAITTLQLFEPDVYALIRDEIEVITHADYRYEDDVKFGTRMEPSSAKKPEVAKQAMAMLFPRLAKVWKSFMADGTYYIIQKEQRRICTKEYHRNYFVFGRDHRMLSRAEVEEVLLSPGPSVALSATLTRLGSHAEAKGQAKVANLLEQVGEALYAKPLLTPALLKALLDQSDDLIRREDAVWEMFVRDNYERLGSIVRLGLEKLDAEKRADILEVLVNHGVGLLARSHAIEEDARRHGLFGGEMKHESERLFAADKIEVAARSVCGQIAVACENGSIWQMPMPVRLIWARRRMSDADTLKSWFKRVIENDEWIIHLANDLPGRSYQSGGGAGFRVVWTFKRDSYKDMLDVDVLFARLEILAKNNEEAARALNRLREAEAEGRN
jgi:predicted KAP-like P-loop ATPase